MIGERRYRGGSRGRSPPPLRLPPRSRDVNPPRDWKLSPYRQHGVEEYSGEAKPSRRIEEGDHFNDRLSRFSEYDDRDRYKDGGRRFRSPRIIEGKVNIDRNRPANLSNYGDGAKGDYDNEVSVEGSRRSYNEDSYHDDLSSMKLKCGQPLDGFRKSDLSYNEDSYRGDLSSIKLKWDHPLDGSRKSDHHLSWKDYGLTCGSSGVGDVNVSSSGDRDYHLQNHYLESSRAGLLVSRYLDNTVPVPLKYENIGKMHSDSYTLARGVDDLPVSNLSGSDGGSRVSYVASEYLNGDAYKKRCFHFRDEPHLKRRDGLNDREDNYFEKKSGGLSFQDRYQGRGKTVKSEMNKFKKEDNLLSSRDYLKRDSDYMVSTSQHEDYNFVPLGISREHFSGYSHTRDLHLPSSDNSQHGSRLASQPIHFDEYSETKQSMLLTESGGQLDNKRSSSDLCVGLPENRQGDWSYAKSGRSKMDSISARVNDVEEDYRDQHISRINALKWNIDASSHGEEIGDDGLWHQYPSFQVQSTPEKFDVQRSLHLRREAVGTLGTKSTRLNYGAEGYYGYGGVKTEKHHADADMVGCQWSHYENSDPLLSRECDPTYDGVCYSPRKRLSMVDLGLVESCKRGLRDKHIMDEMLYEHDIGIRISADGNGPRRICNQVDVEDRIDLLHFSKKPKSSRYDYEKTWKMSSGLHSDEPSSSEFQSNHSIKPQKSDSRDIKKRLGPAQKLHVSQRLVKKYKPSIKKRFARPPSKKHSTLPWIKA